MSTFCCRPYSYSNSQLLHYYLEVIETNEMNLLKISHGKQDNERTSVSKFSTSCQSFNPSIFLGFVGYW